nr:PD-(D/E)XK motif protein [Desulfobacterales bacterium]
MNDKLEEIWGLLEEKVRSGDYSGNRAYRRLELDRETGLRLGIVSPGNIRELLIQIDTTDEKSFGPPKWMGMRFEIILMDAPERRTRHIRLYLSDVTHKSVFTTICADIAETLLKVENPSNRSKELQNCLDRWSRFFQKYGIEGLSPEAQRGGTIMV